MARPTKQDIEDRFIGNVARVRDLVATYSMLVGPGAGRPSVEHADVLRAAVILLHAALEGLLRSAEELKLPGAPSAAFERMRLAPHGSLKEPKEKFTLVDLSAYRGLSVDDVLGKAIDFHLERSNYNNIGELKQTLERAGLKHPLSPAQDATIEAMMKRRHWIVHRADQNNFFGRGHHAAQSIGRDLVDNWVSVIELLGKSVLAQL